MVLRGIIILLIPLGVLGIGTVGYFALVPQPAPTVAEAAAAPPPTIEKTEEILSAAHVLRAGTLIKPDDITTKSTPANGVPAKAIEDTPAARSDMLGAVVRQTIEADAPILPDAFVRVGDHGFLAAVLRPGMRAVSVGVDPVAGLAGLIWPGDYVDLILTQQSDGTGAIGHRVAAETVLHGIRVIAVDQDLVQGGSGGTSPGSGNAQQNRTVTLETSPADAERVAIAGRLGRLTLTVVAIDEAGVSDARVAAPAPQAGAGRRPTKGPGERAAVLWGSDVSAALEDDRKKETAPGLLVYDGTAEGKEVHFK